MLNNIKKPSMTFIGRLEKNRQRSKNMLNFDDLRPLAADLPPITLLSSIDHGGAGLAALELLQGLRAAGIDANMLVMDQKYHTDGVRTAFANGKSAMLLYMNLLASALRRYPNRPQGYEFFSINRSLVDLASFEAVNRASLIHLHWTPGLVSFPQALNALQSKPLVWTLHDMHPFTGGCHYTAGCEQFVSGSCSHCPQLAATDRETDLAAENFAAKRNGYVNLNLHVATPSRWLGECARASALLGAFPQVTIPNAIAVNTFAPIHQDHARAILNLPMDKKIVVFSATSTNRQNKGFHVLVQALECLRAQWPGKMPLLLIVGALHEETLLQEYECHSLGFVEDKVKLATAYSAADLFVLPSFQDNLPNTLLEAQACGTPGIGFYGTGAEDIIQDSVTGYLATPPGLPLKGGMPQPSGDVYFFARRDSVEDLAVKIHAVLDLSPDAYAAMRRACREHALTAYTPELHVGRYLQLYRRLLGLPEIFLAESLDCGATS